MAELTLQIPDELLEELQDVSEQLKCSANETVMLALSHIMQKDTLDNAIEGIARIDDEEDNEIISFPEIKEELDLDINFHRAAMEELNALDEEEQIELIGHLVDRLSEEEDELGNEVDLVLRDEEDNSVILSCFDFGDIVYKLGNEITIFHIAMNEPLEDEDFDELMDEEFDEELEEVFDEDED